MFLYLCITYLQLLYSYIKSRFLSFIFKSFVITVTVLLFYNVLVLGPLYSFPSSISFSLKLYYCYTPPRVPLDSSFNFILSFIHLRSTLLILSFLLSQPNQRILLTFLALASSYTNYSFFLFTNVLTYYSIYLSFQDKP
jgi:hypothetical protein